MGNFDFLLGIKEYEAEIKELNSQKTTAPIDQLYSTKVDSLAISKKSSITDAINAIRKILSSNYAEEFHGSHSDIEKKKNMEVIIKKSETKNPSDEHLMMSKMIIEALMENVEFSRDYIKIKLYK